MFVWIGLVLIVTGSVRGEDLRVDASIPARALVPLVAASFREAQPETTLLTEVCDTSKVFEGVRSGQCHVGIVTRNLKPPELLETPPFEVRSIGTDALVVAVPSSNSVKNLTSDQVRGIWTGAIVNWHELGGPNLPIRVIGRTKKYDPIQLFGDFMKLEARFDDSAAQYRAKGEAEWGAAQVRVVETDEVALQELLRDPRAVSYFPIARLLKERANGIAIKGLALDGVEATPATVVDQGAYYLRRTLNVFTKGPPSPASERFIEMLLSDRGQQLVAEAGFMPLVRHAQSLPGRVTQRSSMSHPDAEFVGSF